MRQWMALFLSIFALYRLASLVSSDEGPYLPFLYRDEEQTGVFKWLRTQAGADIYGPDGLPATNLARGITCPLCTSAYLAVPLVAFVYLTASHRWRLGNPILFWLGIWGGQTFLENLTSDEAIQGAIQEVAESMEESDA